MSHRPEMRREVAEALDATAEAITTAGGRCGDLSSSQRPRRRLNQAASPYDSAVSGPRWKVTPAGKLLTINRYSCTAVYSGRRPTRIQIYSRF
jgi:hypothetical protein